MIFPTHFEDLSIFSLKKHYFRKLEAWSKLEIVPFDRTESFIWPKMPFASIKIIYFWGKYFKKMLKRLIFGPRTLLVAILSDFPQWRFSESFPASKFANLPTAQCVKSLPQMSSKPNTAQCVLLNDTSEFCVFIYIWHLPISSICIYIYDARGQKMMTYMLMYTNTMHIISELETPEAFECRLYILASSK